MGDLSSGEGLQTQRGQNPSGLRPRMLTISMSRNRLFLGKVALQQSPPPLRQLN